MIKEFFKPTARKILTLIILLVLLSFINFLPNLLNPLSCTATCVVMFGQPLFPFLTLNIKEGKISPALNIIGLIIDLVIIYLILCALFYIFRTRKKEVTQLQQELYTGEEKNVPTSNS